MPSLRHAEKLRAPRLLFISIAVLSSALAAAVALNGEQHLRLPLIWYEKMDKNPSFRLDHFRR